MPDDLRVNGALCAFAAMDPATDDWCPVPRHLARQADGDGQRSEEQGARHGFLL